MMHQVLDWLSLLFDSHITSFHRQIGALEVRCLLPFYSLSMHEALCM